MKSIIEQLADEFRHYPDWGLYYPRRVQPVPGYLNMKYMAVHNRCMDDELKQRDWDNKEYNKRNLMPSLHAVVCMGNFYRWPTYHVAEEFAQSVSATEPPDDMMLSQLRVPMPSFNMLFPLEFTRRLTGGWTIGAINVTSLPGGEVNTPSGICGSPGPMLVVHVIGLLDNGLFSDYCGWYPTKCQIKDTTTAPYFDKYMALASDAPMAKIMEDFPEMKAKLPTVEDDKALLQSAVTLAVKTILVLNCLPTQLQTGAEPLQRPARIKKGIVVKEAIYSPLWIGKNYKIRRELQGKGSGTHASPEMHWRRGYARWQHHGPKNSLKKIVLIEPVLVNKPKDENETTEKCK